MKKNKLDDEFIEIVKRRIMEECSDNSLVSKYEIELLPLLYNEDIIKVINSLKSSIIENRDYLSLSDQEKENYIKSNTNKNEVNKDIQVLYSVIDKMNNINEDRKIINYNDIPKINDEDNEMYLNMLKEARSNLYNYNSKIIKDHKNIDRVIDKIYFIQKQLIDQNINRLRILINKDLKDKNINLKIEDLDMDYKSMYNRYTYIVSHNKDNYIKADAINNFYNILIEESINKNRSRGL